MLSAVNCSQSNSLLSIQLNIPNHDLPLPKLMVGIPTSVNLLEIILHRLGPEACLFDDIQIN